MKLHGIAIEPPKAVILPIPRLDELGKEIFIELTIKPVLDYTNFDTLCPAPKRRTLTMPNGEVKPDPQHAKEYDKLVAERSGIQVTWMILESLKATDGLAWETVVDTDPTTWDNYRDELTASGFSMVEINNIVGSILKISGLSPGNLDEARKRFLALKQEKSNESS